MGTDTDFMYEIGKYKTLKEELNKIFIDRRFIEDKIFRKYLVKTIKKYKENANDPKLIEYVKRLLSSHFPPSYVGGKNLFIETGLFDESTIEKITKEALIRYLISTLEIKLSNNT